MILILHIKCQRGSDLNLTGYTGVCKIRKRPNEAVIFELNATVEEKSVTFSLAGDVSAKNSYRLKTLYMTHLFIMRAIISSLAMAKLHLFKTFQCINQRRY